LENHSHTSPIISELFYNNEEWPDHPNPQTEVENSALSLFRAWMEALSNGTIRNISLLDIPAVLSSANPDKAMFYGCLWPNQPKGSFYGDNNYCSDIQFINQHAVHWDGYLEGYYNYSDVSNDTCSNYTNTKLGGVQNLKVWMKIMKFSQDGDSNGTTIQIKEQQ
jgi:hypothetical protein